MSDVTAAQRVKLARAVSRPGAMDYINALFTDLFVCKGDRLHREDPCVFGAIARFHGKPVTVIGTRKGRTFEEKMKYNFGMPSPEGYRKAQRLMRQAEKFKRPIITFVDTPGAYPGLEAEAEGQGQAIAASLALMSSLTVPVIAVVIGEAGSGGALALAVGNRVILLENAVYSVLSPEGFASILWKDAGRADEAAEVMKLTAADLLRLGVADQVIPEPEGGAQNDPKAVFAAVDKALTRHLNQLSKEKDLAAQRYQKFRAMGVVREETAAPESRSGALPGRGRISPSSRWRPPARPSPGLASGRRTWGCA